MLKSHNISLDPRKKRLQTDIKVLPAFSGFSLVRRRSENYVRNKEKEQKTWQIKWLWTDFEIKPRHGEKLTEGITRICCRVAPLPESSSSFF